MIMIMTEKVHVHDHFLNISSYGYQNRLSLNFFDVSNHSRFFVMATYCIQGTAATEHCSTLYRAARSSTHFWQCVYLIVSPSSLSLSSISPFSSHCHQSSPLPCLYLPSPPHSGTPPLEEIACTPPTCLHLSIPMLWTKSTIMRKILPSTTTTPILLLKRMMVNFAHLHMTSLIPPPLCLLSCSARLSVMPKVVQDCLKLCICCP